MRYRFWFQKRFIPWRYLCIELHISSSNDIWLFWVINRANSLFWYYNYLGGFWFFSNDYLLFRQRGKILLNYSVRLLKKRVPSSWGFCTASQEINWTTEQVHVLLAVVHSLPSGNDCEQNLPRGFCPADWKLRLIPAESLIRYHNLNLQSLHHKFTGLLRGV